MKLKDKSKFTITITERDRQEAQEFCNNGSCLIATALKRRGFKDVHEAVTYVRIGEADYNHEYLGDKELCKIRNRTKAPFYSKRVVGKKIVFTKEEESVSFDE